MRARRLVPEHEAKLFIVAGKDKDIFFKEKISEEKGYGIFSTKDIEPGEFILEYVGVHLTGSDGDARLQKYSDEKAFFLYFYTFQGKTLCVDGSEDTTRLGRFLKNDSTNPNCRVKLILDEHDKPHICTFAIKKIPVGEELVYDYEYTNRPKKRQNPKTDSLKAPITLEVKISSSEHHVSSSEHQESRWNGAFAELCTKPGVKKIGDLLFNRNIKIAKGFNGTLVFPGLYENQRVSVKRVIQGFHHNELKMFNLMLSKKPDAQHLLPYTTFKEDEDFVYFVSPLCEYSLEEFIKNEDLSLRERWTDQRKLEICKHLLLGLQELHAVGIIHGDLKPANILFDLTGKLYLAGFGSRTKDDHENTLRTDPASPVASCSYALAKGNMMVQSDIQAVGCLLYYVLTEGHHPCETTTPYIKDLKGLSHNLSVGLFILDCHPKWIKQKQIISQFLRMDIDPCPTIQECLNAFSSVPVDDMATMRSTESENDTIVCDAVTVNLEETFSESTSTEPIEASIMDFNLKCDATDSSDMETDESDAPSHPSLKEVLVPVVPAIEETGHGKIEQDDGKRGQTSSNAVRRRASGPKSYCAFCEKPYSNVSRHLQQKHSNESDVAVALSQTRGSRPRRLAFDELLNRGNYLHNCRVLRSGQGKMVPKRRSDFKDYRPCQVCKELYLKTEIWEHRQRCDVKTATAETGQTARGTSAPPPPGNVAVSKRLGAVLSKMARDDVGQVAVNDPLILKLGERLYTMNGELPRYHSVIRNEMRELARLVLEARRRDQKVEALRDLLEPSEFSFLIDTVKTTAGFDEFTNRYETPSTALKLRHSLEKVAAILRGEALRRGDDALERKMRQFQQLVELEWDVEVSSNALKTIQEKTGNAVAFVASSESYS